MEKPWNYLNSQIINENKSEKDPGSGRTDPFLAYVRNYYFDSEVFFHSIVPLDTSVWIFCGDVQKNVYYISEQIKEEFGFGESLVHDFIKVLEQRIYEADREKYRDTFKKLIDRKLTRYSIHIRIYNCRREPVWVYFQGIAEWDETTGLPLFFSGSMIPNDSQTGLGEEIGVCSLEHLLRGIRMHGEEEHGKELLLICFSLKEFESINQLVGHRQGNSVIRNILSRIKHELGEYFWLVRLGGVNFMAISEDSIDPEEPIDRIREIVRETYHMYQLSIVYPCSIGVMKCPRDGTDSDELLKNAEIVLKHADELPGQKYVEFTKDMEESYCYAVDLGLELNRCINNNFENFRLVVQPQVNTPDGRIVGGEVLCRWKYKGEEISPSVFIPILEKTGLIIPTGKWIVSQAVEICSRILEYMPEFRLSFNVSYLQVTDETFFAFIRDALEKNHVPGGNMIVELTESYFDETSELLEKFIWQCKNHGIRLALDDFGEGYSSIHLLLHYPVDLIKLDRFLVQELMASEEKRKLIFSIIAECHKFGKKICMEGVETREELEIVRQTGCDCIQGFYFYRPLEVDALYKLLEDYPKGATER